MSNEGRFWEDWADPEGWEERWLKQLARPYKRVGGYAWRYARVIVYERDGRICSECKGTTLLSVHHRRPLWLGGNSLPENLEVKCKKCHRRRHKNHRMEKLTTDPRSSSYQNSK